uniref:Pyrin domain-containing protein n=1 Tax=Xiphophorus couchianus TaxID=32473 RepID=A0A3B5MTG2_9TELE
MAPKKPKKVLANILENLSERNFKKFCSELLDRDKRVKRSQVERKDFLEVAEVIIEKYADEALKVAEELLQQIDCEQAAHDLGEYGHTIRIHSSCNSCLQGSSAQFQCFFSLESHETGRAGFLEKRKQVSSLQIYKNK